MSEIKNTIAKIKRVVPSLSPELRAYVLGFAEGAASVKNAADAKPEEKTSS